MTSYKEVTTSQHDQGQNGRVATFKVTQLIWLFLGILRSITRLEIYIQIDWRE